MRQMLDKVVNCSTNLLEVFSKKSQTLIIDVKSEKDILQLEYVWIERNSHWHFEVNFNSIFTYLQQYERNCPLETKSIKGPV